MGNLVAFLFGAKGTSKRRGTYRALMACMLTVTCSALGVGAHATSTSFDGTAFGLGMDGAPAASDYTGAVNGFETSTAPILTSLLPYLALIMATWMGPGIGHRLVKQFTH
jgi:hypothetical protein